MMNTNRYTGTGTEFYRAPIGIANTVNLAIELGRPLLVEGEPGCGKTQLAYSIAAEKGLELIKVSVKSTSEARELLYLYDSLRRLQDAQDAQSKVKPRYHYITLGPLGRAINSVQQCVVLIDEVDKADVDFPNDLLDVLDTFSFQIPDLADLTEAEEKLCRKEKGFGYQVEAQSATRPIVIITSNREKQLPEPFLRRCLYIHLEFPKEAQDLEHIVRMNIAPGTMKWTPRALNDEILNAAISSFMNIRRLSINSEVRKLPTTSELIDWVRILHLMKQSGKIVLDKGAYPPYWNLLFKAKQDLDAYDKLARSEQEKASVNNK